MRSLLAGAASIALLVSASAARACGGVPEFYGRWSLDHRDYSGERRLPFVRLRAPQPLARLRANAAGPLVGGEPQRKQRIEARIGRRAASAC